MDEIVIDTLFDELGIDYNSVHRRRRSIEFDPKEVSF